METASPPSEGNLKPLVVVAAGVAIAALGWGFGIDSQPTITQPQLFWPLLVFGLLGGLVGWRLAMRNDPDPLRNLIGLAGSLIAWRVSYFPFMVLAGWMASLGEFASWSLTGHSIVYPTYLLLLFMQHAGVGFVGAAVVATPQTPVPGKGRLLSVRRLFHSPPRKVLWALACIALPVAAMVSFSTPQDFVLFNDGPTRALHVPPVGEPQANPYEIIIREHDLSIPAWMLAINARLTYPLVPESPWGKAMKGTLEQLALQRPQATTRDRIDEHYQAYMAAHARLHPGDAK